MKRIQFVGKKTGKNRVRFLMPEREYAALNEDNAGLCISCGDLSEGVEPDARHYHCHQCEQMEVFGIEELLLKGYISFE